MSLELFVGHPYTGECMVANEQRNTTRVISYTIRLKLVLIGSVSEVILEADLVFRGIFDGDDVSTLTKEVYIAHLQDFLRDHCNNFELLRN